MADKVEGVACIQAGQEDETTPTLEWMRGGGGGGGGEKIYHWMRIDVGAWFMRHIWHAARTKEHPIHGLSKSPFLGDVRRGHYARNTRAKILQ